MSDYAKEIIRCLIEDHRLCRECIGNGEDCHGDYVCDVLEDLFEGFTELMWIPVEEQLPDTEDYVLVSCKTKKGAKTVNRSYYSGSYWSGVMSDVEAWMPLPKPYEGTRPWGVNA